MPTLEEVIKHRAEQAGKDRRMLESMANTLRNGGRFEFSGKEMADLLDKIREDYPS